MAEDDEEDAWGKGRNQEDESPAEEASREQPTSRLRWNEKPKDSDLDEEQQQQQQEEEEEEEERSTSPTTTGSRADTEDETMWEKMCGSTWKKVAFCSVTIAVICAIVALILYGESARIRRELLSKNTALEYALHKYTEASDSLQREVPESQCTRYEDTFLNWLQSFCKIVDCSSELCHKNWTPFGGNCYFFSKTILGWEESRQECISQGSELLVIRSEEEQQFVAEYNASRIYWIGIKDNPLEAAWTWVDGTFLQDDLIYWDRNYPDSYFDYDQEAFKNCVFLRSGAWANAVCTEAHYWICKRRSEMPPINL